jgi:biopolymer transport protein ExbB
MDIKTEVSQNVLSLLMKGGWLMVPLLLLSLVGVYVLIERLLTYRTYLNLSESFLETLDDQLQSGDIHQLQKLCTPADNIIQKVLLKGIQSRQTAAKSTECILESESKRIIATLEERLAILATIAGVAPMIGFLGTVTGMIQTFMSISQEKSQLATQLFSNGIYEAMVTTMVGLIIGIIAYIGYNYCLMRVTKAADRLSYAANLFLAKWILK